MRINVMLKMLALCLVISVCSAPMAFGADHTKILKSLLRTSDTNIPDNHCEINGSKSVGVNHDVTVGDLLANYLSFSLSESTARKRSMDCSGEKELACIFGYGERPNTKNPGWDIFLKFQYNSVPDKIIVDSLQCIQVP